MGLIKKKKLRERQTPVSLKKRKLSPAPSPPAIIPKKSPAEQALSPVPPPPEPSAPGLISEKVKSDKIYLHQQLEAELEQKRTHVETELTERKNKALGEIEQAKEQARNEGQALGREEGLKAYAEKSAELLQTFNDAVKEKNKIIKAAEGGLLKLSIKIAEQIIRSEISLNQAVCLNIVSEAINKITDRDQVIVKVNGVDLELVKRNRDRLSALIDGVKSFSIVEDFQVDPGGCIVETNLGYIDARIKTKLDVVQAALLKVHDADMAAEEEPAPPESSEPNNG